jgi:hypothetical protein
MERFASLNVRLDERFKAQQEALHAALAAVDKAMDKAEIASEKRFDGVTSSVQQVNAQTAGYLLREEYASAHSALVGKVDTAQATNNERFREMELRLTSRLDLMQGKGAGLNAGWAYLVAAIGVAAAIITVIIATRP